MLSGVKQANNRHMTPGFRDVEDEDHTFSASWDPHCPNLGEVLRASTSVSVSRKSNLYKLSSTQHSHNALEQPRDKSEDVNRCHKLGRARVCKTK